MTKLNSLTKLLKKTKIIQSNEIEVLLGRREAVAAAVKDGLLLRVGSGFYSAPGIDPNTALLMTVGRFFPKAVISGISALSFYGLSDEQPNKATVDIERKTSLRNQILQIRRVLPKYLIGIETIDLQGVKIRIYDPERALCDAYRIEKDGPIFIKALKRYVKGKKIDSKKIAKYDAILKTRVLSHLKQEIADG